MKLGLIILILALSLQASIIREKRAKMLETKNSFIICKEGYKFLVVTYFRGVGIAQIFKESIYMDSGARPPQPIKCKEN